MRGDSDCPIVEIYLGRGEEVKIERGSMVYSSDVTIEGKMNANKGGLGGMFGAIGRSMTSGESMFITKATGQSDHGKIAVAPSIPGKIQAIEVGERQYRLNTGAFLACDDSVQYVMKTQSLGRAFLGGTGGIFVMETQGKGSMLISAFGDIVPVEVTPENPVTIDNEHVLAWDSSLEYEIRIASGAFGFTTGEGIVNDFHGNGTVLVQTRNLHSLSEELMKYIPSGK